MAAALLVFPGTSGAAQDLSRGTIVDEVKCAADPAQSYALYLPSTYSPDRTWSLLIAFHPAARGRLMVEKYRAAAEEYGYIVAASNTSRNGPWSVSAAAVQAIWPDLGRRFSIDANRIYVTGMSGGARVAMQVALGNNNIAGVIASSAGYPDSQPRKSVPFAVFGTAGTEDFNYFEMRQLDRKLTSPHFLAVFTGGHTLPPDSVAFDAIEWMELQAMASRRRPRDEALVERLFEKRQRKIAASGSTAETVHLLEALVSDFKGLRDMSAEARRVKELSRQPDVKKALSRERADEDAEGRLFGEIADLEAALADMERRDVALMQLRNRLSKIAAAANATEDSLARSQARRALRAIAAGAMERVQDPEYRALLQQYGARGLAPTRRSPSSRAPRRTRRRPSSSRPSSRRRSGNASSRTAGSRGRL
jgi:dienelactone hydrolase